MSDTTRQSAPAERVPHIRIDLLANTPNTASREASATDPTVSHVTTQHGVQNSPPQIPRTEAQTHPDTPLLPRMIEALEEGPTAFRQLLTSMPNTWREVNNTGTLNTKHILTQCTWGEHTETYGL